MAGPGKRALVIGCAVAVCGVAVAWPARLAADAAWLASVAGQGIVGQSRTGQDPAGQGEASSQVVIEREALRLIDPRSLQVPLELTPARAVELTAAVDGFVQTVRFQTGQPLEAQSEAARLDGREEQLLLDKARASVRVAEIELRAARESGESAAVELAEARLDVAKVDVELANLRLERTIVRAPFDGRILRTRTTPGAYIRAGESLGTLADLRQMNVEIPVDRSQTKVGDSLEIRVENEAVQGRVAELLPLADHFEPLRRVIPSVASAVLLIENAEGRFAAGQTVYAPLVPRQPVVEVPVSTLLNAPDGTRRVRVLRGDVVRELSVELLSNVGVDRIFVSGAFAEGDELVLRASRELNDGMRVRPAAPAAARTTNDGGQESEVQRLSPPAGERPEAPRARF